MIYLNLIETERLILREWQRGDLEVFAEINKDPKVLEFMPAPLNFQETAEWIERISQHFKLHGFGLWAVTLKKSGEMIGYTGLNVPTFEAHFTPCVEISWRIASAYWGKGYATEAAKAVLAIAFKEYKLKEIVSLTVPANQRSIRVMEKIGMQRDMSGDFNHPRVSEGHSLSRHVLYKINS
jgi:RimJ/RimL family protein N-acetyltransferase